MKLWGPLLKFGVSGFPSFLGFRGLGFFSLLLGKEEARIAGCLGYGFRVLGFRVFFWGFFVSRL